MSKLCAYKTTSLNLFEDVAECCVELISVFDEHLVFAHNALHTQAHNIFCRSFITWRCYANTIRTVLKTAMLGAPYRMWGKTVE